MAKKALFRKEVNSVLNKTAGVRSLMREKKTIEHSLLTALVHNYDSPGLRSSRERLGHIDSKHPNLERDYVRANIELGFAQQSRQGLVKGTIRSIHAGKVVRARLKKMRESKSRVKK